MTEMTTTTVAELIPTIKGLIEVAAEDVQIFRALGVKEIDFSGPGGTIDLLKIGALTAAAYTEGNARTFSADTATKVAVTPSEIDLAMSFTDKARRRSITDLALAYAPQIGKACGRKIDADCAAEYANFTGTATDEGATTGTIAKFLAACGLAKMSGKDHGVMLRAALHTALWDDLMATLMSTSGGGGILSVSTRGGSAAGAAETGIINMIGGTKIGFSTSIVSVGGTAKYQNMIWNGRVIAVVYKSPILFDAWDDRNNKAQRIAAGADYDVASYFAAEGHLWTVTV